ncbi:MAG: YggS family pyridoxal phosphate-dependent enzyme, partial [Candidatus Omnitrophota bacterium]
MENEAKQVEYGKIAGNLAKIKNLIARAAERSGRDSNDIRLVAVTKTVNIEGIRACINAGQFIFGENYVQELLSKSSEAGPSAGWHFIGHLQTNKVKKTIEAVSMIHTLDRLDLAKEIDKRAAAAGKIMDCLIEVNLGGEATKTGISKDNVLELMASCKLLSNLRI